MALVRSTVWCAATVLVLGFAGYAFIAKMLGLSKALELIALTCHSLMLLSFGQLPPPSTEDERRPTIAGAQQQCCYATAVSSA
mmetsp:Transcript_46483/g.133877  ORF Transcript_46483/g.133877 Transcript_46483/m.133877 type:complete len:83 (+) Transcript_46483:83-331(+)